MTRLKLVPSDPAVPVAASPASPLVADIEAAMHRLLDRMADGAEPLAVRMCREHLATGGKRLRARLAVEACVALGGDRDQALPWAAACELIHNASLVHDDLQDGDRVRRGQEALWSRYGTEQAINAGDLMLMLPTLAVGEIDCDPGLRWELARLVAWHGARTAMGQAEEMVLRTTQCVDVERYLAAARGKTAGLFGLPVEGAAWLAGADASRARRYAAPFEDLGLVYQLVDDVVDLFGDKGREERGADVREGKISALVVLHLDAHPEDRLWLLRVLGTPRERTTIEVVTNVTERFRSGGALAAVLDRVDALCDAVDGDALADAPGLRRFALSLRDRIVAPLGGLRERRRA